MKSKKSKGYQGHLREQIKGYHVLNSPGIQPHGSHWSKTHCLGVLGILWDLMEIKWKWSWKQTTLDSSYYKWPELFPNTVLHHLHRSENCVNRQFCPCANITEGNYTSPYGQALNAASWCNQRTWQSPDIWSCCQGHKACYFMVPCLVGVVHFKIIV